MTDITLISIDGIPGSGKSSTALWLAKMLQKRGTRVRLIPENEKPHPVRFLTDLKNPLAPWLEMGAEEFSSCCLEKFTRFLEMSTISPRKETILVVDGLLFHTDSTSLLLMDPGKGVFERHIEEMHRIGLRVKFCPILFYGQPHATTITTTMTQRSADWKTMQIDWKTSSPYCTSRKIYGSQGYVQFYEHYEKRIYDIFSSLPFHQDHSLTLENPALDWVASREKIWAFCVRNEVPANFLSELF